MISLEPEKSDSVSCSVVSDSVHHQITHTHLSLGTILTSVGHEFFLSQILKSYVYVKTFGSLGSESENNICAGVTSKQIIEKFRRYLTGITWKLVV